MKKQSILKLVLGLGIAFTSLVGCSSVLNKPSDDTDIEEKDERYKIYLKANEAGYDGTYEEWLESIKGADGSSLLNGETDPSSSLGHNGDTYINTKTWDVFVKSGGTWIKVGNIMGQPGPQGNPGEDGVSIISIDLTSSDGLVDTYTITYSDGHTSTFTVTNGADGQDGQSIKGEPGEDGHTPVITIGDNGNWFVDGVDTGIKALGKNGAGVLVGNGVPSSELGSDGDSYINLDNFDYYLKEDGNWVKKGNIKGEQGVSIETVYIDEKGDLIVVFSNGETHNAGHVKDVEPEVYTVTFDSTGGSFVPSQEVVFGYKASKPENPSKDGYAFVDWVDENNDHWVFNGYPITSDITLYAVWERSYVPHPENKVSYEEFHRHALEVAVKESGYLTASVSYHNYTQDLNQSGVSVRKDINSSWNYHSGDFKSLHTLIIHHPDETPYGDNFTYYVNEDDTMECVWLVDDEIRVVYGDEYGFITLYQIYSHNDILLNEFVINYSRALPSETVIGLTVREANGLLSLTYEETSYDKYEITGKVSEIVAPYNPLYGNMTFYIQDEIGAFHKMSVSRISLDEETAAKVLVGSTVTIRGYLTNSDGVLDFNQSPELTNIIGPVVDDITISRTAIEIELEDTFHLSAYPNPSTLADRSVVWSSSDESVAKVSSTGLVTAISQGTATIKAAANVDRTKYAECRVTVIEETTPLSVAEAVEEGNNLNEGQTSEQVYRITGIVCDITTPYSSAFGNISFRIKDVNDDSKTILVYRLGVTEEESYKLLLDALVTVKGYLTLWDGVIQLTAGSKLISAEGGREHQLCEVSVSEALQVELEDGEISYDLYQVTGIITEITKPYTTITGSVSLIIRDLNDYSKTLLIFNLKVTKEQNDKLLIGATLVVKGHLKHYHDVIETDVDAEFISAEGGDEYITVTVGEAIEVINALDDDGITTNAYKVSGVVVSADTYSDQYMNITFTVGDTIEDTAVLTVFRWSTTAEEAAKLVAGAEVEVVATLRKYVKNGEIFSQTKAITSVTIGGEVPPEPEGLFVALSNGTNSIDATINGQDGIKVGTSKSDGDMKVILGKDAKTLIIHVAAWKDKPGTISVTSPAGVTVDQTELTLTADYGISNSSPYTLVADETIYKFTFELSGLTETTELILASGTARRFVVWGATVA